jgi:GNAT superfamily N-acetyltransferase
MHEDARERIERDGYLIRTFEPDDAAAAWDLHVEGLIDNSTDVHQDPAWDADVRAIPEHYLISGSHFWVVADADRLVATSAVRRIDETTAEIKRMRVTRTHRRRGIARLLVEIAEDFCRRNGYQRIILDTTDRQQAAQRLYESLNYTRTHEEPLLALGLTLIHYQKPLT